MMEKEIWKTIEGYDGKYQVSNLGRVRAMWRNNQYQNHIGKPTILKPGKHKQGYLQVYLTLGGKRKTYFIHRLVAEAFIPNPKNLPQVNHKNEMKTDNTVENLEWCDGKYNSNYGTRVERWKLQVAKPIIQTTIDGKFVRRFESAESAERECGYDASYIRQVCTGKRPQAYGYKFHNENDLKVPADIHTKEDGKTTARQMIEILDYLFGDED